MFIHVRTQKEKYVKEGLQYLMKTRDCIPIFSFENLMLCLDSDKLHVLCSVDFPDKRRYSSPREGIFQVNTFTCTECPLLKKSLI